MTDRFNTKQTQCGQYKRYGDFYRVWEIQTEASKEETFEYCFSELHKRRVPQRAEYMNNIKYGAKEWSNADYYFAGWYSLSEIDGGYKFTVCEPYAD